MTVAVIDDDAAVRHSLELLLQGHGLAVTGYAGAEAFLATDSSGGGLQCILSDVRMPGLTGLDLQRELKRRGSTVPLVLITGHGDISMAVTAIKEGAFDFIEKPFDDERLLASIRQAIALAGQLASEQIERSEIAAHAAGLSPRQRQVMDLVAEGLSNKDIALRLGISPRTVENYRAWVMERMEAANLADLVRKVMLLR